MAKTKQHRTAARMTNRVQDAHTTPVVERPVRRPTAKRRPRNGLGAFIRTFPVLTGTILVALVALLGYSLYNNRGTLFPGSVAADPCAWATKPTSVKLPATIVRSYSAAPKQCVTAVMPGEYTVTIHTARGDIAMVLDQQQAPETVNNFVFLATHGFYNGITFHRVVANFVIQAGDPTTANPKADPKTFGQGGPGYTYTDLLPKAPDVYTIGSVAMANSNNNPATTGSQFFISIADNTKTLQAKYFFFGHVTTATLPVIQKIQQGDVIQTMTVAYNPNGVPGALPADPTVTPTP